MLLDPVGASYFEKNLESLSMNGRWVLYGLMGGGKIVADSSFLTLLLRKRLRVEGTTLRARDDEVGNGG